jgi:hypothetical protein
MVRWCDCALLTRVDVLLGFEMLGINREVKGRSCEKARDGLVWTRPGCSVRGRNVRVLATAARGLRNRLVASWVCDLSRSVLPHRGEIMFAIVFRAEENGVELFSVEFQRAFMLGLVRAR